jgi:hypothetical protein
MVWSARISPTKKTALIAMFCGGLITAVAGILRCTFVLLDRPDGPQLAGEWSCRESFIAVFISNLPVMYPIVNNLFVRVKNAASSHSRSKSGQLGKSSEGDSSSRAYKLSSLSKPSKKKDKFKHPLSLPGETFYERFGSEEEIVGTNGGTRTSSPREKQGDVEVGTKSLGGDIMVTRQWQVNNHSHSDLHAEGTQRSGFHAH